MNEDTLWKNPPATYLRLRPAAEQRNANGRAGERVEREARRTTHDGACDRVGPRAPHATQHRDDGDLGARYRAGPGPVYDQT